MRIHPAVLIGIAVFWIISLASCSGSEPEYRPLPGTQARITVTNHGKIHSGWQHIFIIRDEKTGREFLLVTGYQYGSAIEEILPK